METYDSSSTDSDSLLSVDLARYLTALRKYAWVIGAVIVVAVACAVFYTSRITPIYEAKASVQIEPRLPDLLGTGDIFNVAAGANSTEYYKQQRQVLASYTLTKQTVVQYDMVSKLLTEEQQKTLSTEEKIDKATQRLMAMIKVRYPDQNRIMYVTVLSSDPELATEIANNHVSTYVSYAKGLLSINSTQASDALQAEFNEAERKLRAAEDKIYKFQAENDMIAMTLEEHQNLVSQNILNFTQKLNDARASEIAVSARLAEMRKETNVDVLSTPITMMGSNPSYDQLRGQYYIEKIRLIELAKELGPKNPDYVAQQQKVDELRQALEREVRILLEGTSDLHSAAVTTSKALASEVERYKNEARRLSPKIVQYNEFLREKKLLEDQYNILRARLSTTQLTGNMSSAISNVRPLDPARTPTHPVSPRMPVNIAIAVVLAVLIGLGFVFLVVFLDRSIKSAADATQASAAPVLGLIPALSSAEFGRNKGDLRARDMYVHEHPTSHVAESCRVMRTNVMFSAATGGDSGHELKTMVVCSANAQEGKTTTVMYLGTTMAQSGQRVLLVDTDMRRPRLHVSAGVSREPGLSNLLLGEDIYDAVIKSTDVPNLFVLPCGPLPPNPAELLMTKRFEQVLEELEKRFTKVILDSPPLLPVTDGMVLARRSDGVIIVVRAGRTLREELRRSAKMVRGVSGNIFGVVVNDCEERDVGYGYYYGRYGYTQVEDESPVGTA